MALHHTKGRLRVPRSGAIIKPVWFGSTLVPHVTKTFVTYALPRLSHLFNNIYQPIAHAQCICNEVVAVSNRVLSPSHLLDRGSVAFWVFQQHMTRVMHTWPVLIPRSLRWIAEHARSDKRASYLFAVDTLSLRPLCAKDTNITLMTKREKIDPGAKVDPDPRAIMYRNKRFTVSALTYIHSQEEYTFRRNHKNGSEGPFGWVYAKYLDAEGRADAIRAKCRYMDTRGPWVCFKTDQSRYDMHLLRHIDKASSGRRLKSMAGKRPDFGTIYPAFYENEDRIRSKNGLFVKGKCGRKSGDSLTSWGNSTASVDMEESFMWAAGFDQADWTLFDDGDDMLTWVLLKDVDRFLPIVDYYRDLGFDVKIEDRTSSIEKIVFCQAQPVNLGNKWRMIRNPYRVMSRGTTILYNANQASNRRDHCFSTGMCELALGCGVPVLQEYALALIRNSPGGRVVQRHMVDYEIRRVRLSDAKAQPITQEARFSFSRAFGIPPSDQLQMEDQLRRWYFDPTADEVGFVARDPLFRVLQA